MSLATARLAELLLAWFACAHLGAVCVITTWQGSTLDADFPPGTDNNTVVRLCDLAYAGSCLDQRPH